MIRYHILVYGEVQGVGFRYFVRMTASRLGICGWVRNNYDGSVEIDSEGDAPAMEEFIKAIREGNRFSRVEGVYLDRLEHPEGSRGFRIAEDR